MPNKTNRVATASTAFVCGVVLAMSTGHGAPKPKPGLGGGDAAATKLYRECMARIAKDPSGAFEHALAWHATGGGFAARHCSASALQASKHYEEAARRLVALARDMKASPVALRARILEQAADAWLDGGHAKAALQTMTAAVKLDPDNLAVRARRGVMRAITGDTFAAIDDFNAVLEAKPESADVLVLRAAAYRRLKSPKLAARDLEQALKLKPDHPDALLERGLLRALAKDRAGARADWVRILQVAPKSAAAQIARARLAKLDYKAK